MKTILQTPVHESDHRIGSLRASALLVEYGDFESAECANAEPFIHELVDDFGYDFCYVYRHFPMALVHPGSTYAALAAEAAQLQGKFWAMHHLLHENFASLDRESVDLIAKDLKLDMDRFHQDVQRSDIIKRIQQSIEGAIKSGVHSAPTFFLNGEIFVGSESEMRQAIQLIIDRGRAEFAL